MRRRRVRRLSSAARAAAAAAAAAGTGVWATRSPPRRGGARSRRPQVRVRAGVRGAVAAGLEYLACVELPPPSPPPYFPFVWVPWPLLLLG